MVNNRRKFKLMVFALFLVFSVLGPAHGVFAENDGEVTIDAAGSVDYDTTTNVTVANQQVKLTDGIMTIEADHMTYNASTGLVNASGKVKVIRKDGVYSTEALNYNLKDQMGSTGSFNGTIYGRDKDAKITGSELKSTQGEFQFKDGKMTRCPLDNPHYTLTAKRIIFKDKKITFERAVLRLRGLPVFFFRTFTWESGQKNNFPGVEGGYNNTDGTWVKVSRSFNETSQWFIGGKTKDKGYLEAGLVNSGPMGTGVFQNTVWGGQEFAGSSRVGDKFSYDGKLIQFSTDGYYTFGGSFKNEEGLSITRKYWHSGLGDWQFGLEARRTVEWSGAQKYGGTWGGYRLDYRPVSNLTLSYLRRDDFNGLTKNDYGNFDPNLGSSVMADWGIPLSDKLRFNVSGVYNLTEQKLRENFYRINWSTCCYDMAVGWNSVNNTMELTGNIKF